MNHKKIKKLKQNKLTEFTEVVIGSELDELDNWNHITDIMMREYRDKDGNWKINFTK
jgi:hypothetical protein